MCQVLQPDWEGVKIVVTSAMAQMYRRKGNEAFVERMDPHGMSAKKLSVTSKKGVVMVRPSLMRDYAKNGVEPTANDAWSWAMWRGYLKNDDGRLAFWEPQLLAAHWPPCEARL